MVLCIDGLCVNLVAETENRLGAESVVGLVGGRVVVIVVVVGDESVETALLLLLLLCDIFSSSLSSVSSNIDRSIC